MLDNPSYGEDVDYLVDGLAINLKPIRAFVYRGGMGSVQKRFDKGTEGVAPNYDISIRISTGSEKGISKILVKHDVVMVAKYKNGTKTKMRVAEILEQDAGSWKLGLVP